MQRRELGSGSARRRPLRDGGRDHPVEFGLGQMHLAQGRRRACTPPGAASSGEGSVGSGMALPGGEVLAKPPGAASANRNHGRLPVELLALVLSR